MAIGPAATSVDALGAASGQDSSSRPPSSYWAATVVAASSMRFEPFASIATEGFAPHR